MADIPPNLFIRMRTYDGKPKPDVDLGDGLKLAHQTDCQPVCAACQIEELRWKFDQLLPHAMKLYQERNDLRAANARLSRQLDDAETRTGESQ